MRFEGITICDYVQAGMPTKDGEEVKKVLSLVGLDPERYMSRKADASLSGGERKRVELASVVAMKPKLLILDEPDSGLDIIVYEELFEMLESIRSQTHASILLITHREESIEIADEATLIWEGKVVKNGGFEEVMWEYCRLAGRDKICKRAYCRTRS